MLKTTRLAMPEEAAALPELGTITLDRQARARRRIVLATDDGAELLLDRADASPLREGDLLLLEGDAPGTIRVKAAAETLLQIHAHDAAELARIAWHLGNRHTRAEITPHAIYIEPDHVLAEMVAGLGGHVHRVRRPFDPEGGAYSGGGHGHRHHHEHDHDHGEGGR